MFVDSDGYREFGHSCAQSHRSDNLVMRGESNSKLRSAMEATHLLNSYIENYYHSHSKASATRVKPEKEADAYPPLRCPDTSSISERRIQPSK